MEAPAERRAPVAAAAEPVYRLAGALGSELQRLSGLFGPGAVAGLVPQVVRLLELLEALAAGGPERDQGPARARQRLQEAGEPSPGPTRDLAQALELRLAEAQERERLLQSHLAQAEAENQRLLAQLAGTQSQEENTQRREKEVMLRLKEVVDKQRDEIRAQAHEILCKARDTEALQEQLNRFMTVNEEIRRKLAIVQAQLQSALQRKEELESALLEARQEVERLSKAAGAAKEALRTSTTDRDVAPGEELPGSGQGRRSYSKEELQQILQERNELKTSLFLVQEELAYYQRELLNDERIPSLLLDAVKSTIKKQRRKIRAKMLGTAEEPLSSDEEEEAVWLASPMGSDCVDSRLPESKIRSFFGLWYRGSSKSSSPEDCPGAWEIVDPPDVGPEEEEQGGREASCSFSPPSGPSPFP